MRTKFLAFSCQHQPTTHVGYQEWLLEQIRVHKPDVIVNLGDWYEGLAASRWPKHPTQVWTLFDEHRAVAKQAREINEVAPTAKRWWLYGNHDSNLFNEPHRIPEDLKPAVQWRAMPEICKPLFEWDVLDVYSHRSKRRLGPVTFQHGTDLQQSAEKDNSYHYGTPFGLYVAGHTHRPLRVTQCRERKALLPYWYANVGCGMDFEKAAHYMNRASMNLWGRACIIGDCAGADQRRTAYASRQWDAEVLVHSMSNPNATL